MIWPQEATLVRWTQPSGPLCLWQCFVHISKQTNIILCLAINPTQLSVKFICFLKNLIRLIEVQQSSLGLEGPLLCCRVALIFCEYSSFFFSQAGTDFRFADYMAIIPLRSDTASVNTCPDGLKHFFSKSMWAISCFGGDGTTMDHGVQKILMPQPSLP